MAGDWIKVEHATCDKPEVLRMAELLGISRREMVGLLVDFWIWLDRNSRYGSVTHMSRISVDLFTHCAGFSASLADVGWVKIDEETGKLTVTHFNRHNGKSAKSRALSKDRMQRLRYAKSNDGVTQHASLEKRRVSKTTRETSRSKSNPVDNSSNGVDWTNPVSLAAYGARIGHPAKPGESTPTYAARLRKIRP